MAKFKFVGFQEHVEIPEGYQPLELIEVIPSSLDKDSLFRYISVPEKISQWFYEVTEIDTRPGGKVQCIDRDGQPFEGRCTAIALGREISLLADPFGQMSAKVISIDSGAALEIRFHNLTDDEKTLTAQYKEFLERLQVLVK